MKVNIEKLVSEARAKLGKNKDASIWCMTNEIRAFLKAGATPISINEELIRGTYLHKVSYEGITFTNVTESPVRKLKKYAKNK